MSIRKFREARSRRREEKKKRNRWTRYETIHGYREEGGRLRNLEDSRNALESLDRRDSIRNMSSSQRAREREREGVQRRAGSSRGRSNVGVKEEIRAINLGCTRGGHAGKERSGWNTKFELQSKEIKEILAVRLNSFPRRRFGNFVIENLYRVSGKKIN